MPKTGSTRHKSHVSRSIERPDVLKCARGKNPFSHGGGRSLCRLSSSLTFDPEPGVGGDVAGLVGGQALKHAAVLLPHVADVERVVVLQHAEPQVGRLGEGHPVPVPDDVGGGAAVHGAGQGQRVTELAQGLQRRARQEVRFFCEKEWKNKEK